jgi:EAL domain-containing protein (putative c-di-GMP-specific phosphodiesterase class I)
MAVNMSGRSLFDTDVVGRVEALLVAADLDPRWLTLEVTESSVMADQDRSGRVIEALSGLGVQLAIDDFGTGYSSLRRLKQLPIQVVKIDRSFVMQMSRDADDAAIVRSTIDLARHMGHTVVAEGVEDQETWDQLVALGCHGAQGFLLARAMPAARFEAWLQQRRRGRLSLVPPSITHAGRCSRPVRRSGAGGRSR